MPLSTYSFELGFLYLLGFDCRQHFVEADLRQNGHASRPILLEAFPYLVGLRVDCALCLKLLLGCCTGDWLTNYFKQHYLLVSYCLLV